MNNLPDILARDPIPEDKCNPSPCGSNALCDDGICTCLPEFQGNAYAGCRPECVLNNDCPRDRACIRNKCDNPCQGGACASNAQCAVINHVPMCSCPTGMTGNAFSLCSVIAGTADKILKKTLSPIIPLNIIPNTLTNLHYLLK